MVEVCERAHIGRCTINVRGGSRPVTLCASRRFPLLDLDQFITDCRNALAADKSHKLVREVVARAVANPAAVLKALGEPTRGVRKPLYRSGDLTSLNIVWAPYMTLLPHNHTMWEG